MTDRELLELAAKAAGIGVTWVEDHKCLWIDLGQGLPIDVYNPLDNDGDALRLAVKLRMSVEISEYEQSTYVYAGKVPRVYACEMWRDDKDASTRRAITRAAAEIGKAMP